MRPRVFDHEAAIQEFEAQRGHRKEIHGVNRLAVIGQEGPPALARIIPPPEAFQISGHRAFGHLEAELPQFTLDLRCAPAQFLFR
jgi:hypothetical protein